jgi:hypothetical protein
VNTNPGIVDRFSIFERADLKAISAREIKPITAEEFKTNYRHLSNGTLQVELRRS